MASISDQGTPKRLTELLEEEQDPFVLDNYLLERGCRPKSMELQRQIGCFSTRTNSRNSLSKLLKRSTTYHEPYRASSKSSGQFSKIARILYKKFILMNHVLRLKNSGLLGMRKHCSNHRARSKEKETAVAELGRFSSVSSSTVGNTFSESDMDTESVSSPSNHENHEIGGVMTQWRSVEENKQHSPVSVLDQIDFSQTIPVYNGYGNETVRQEETPSASKIRIQKKVSEDSILSASMWELIILSRRDKTKQPKSELLPQFINSKKALQQTRQLLFDCVREVVENQNRKRKRKMRIKQKGLMMGPEEIAKSICNNLNTWGKLSADETNIKQLLRMDLISSSEEEQWSDYEAYKKSIAFEIGDGLLEGIEDEIVRDMIGQF